MVVKLSEVFEMFHNHIYLYSSVGQRTRAPKGQAVLPYFEKYSEFEGKSVLSHFISCGQVLLLCTKGFSPDFYRLKIEKIGYRIRWLEEAEKPYFKPKIACRHSSAGQSIRLLRESRGIPQREKMKNNFQFESILKNAKGDNKAFPKLGNVLMLPNQKNLQIDNSKKS